MLKGRGGFQCFYRCKYNCSKTSSRGKQHGNWGPAVTLRGGGVTDGDWCSARITVFPVVGEASCTIAAGSTHTENHGSLVTFTFVMSSVAGAMTVGARVTCCWVEPRGNPALEEAETSSWFMGTALAGQEEETQSRSRAGQGEGVGA